MDAKPEALARAKKAIVSLQRQMTERALKVAAEVETLMAHLTPRSSALASAQSLRWHRI